MFILCIDFPCSLPINMERTVLTPGIVSSYVMANREQLWPILSQQLPQGIAELFPLTSFIPGANFDPILYIGLNCAIASKDLFMHGEGESALSSILLCLFLSLSLLLFLPTFLFIFCGKQRWIKCIKHAKSANTGAIHCLIRCHWRVKSELPGKGHFFKALIQEDYFSFIGGGWGIGFDFLSFCQKTKPKSVLQLSQRAASYSSCQHCPLHTQSSLSSLSFEVHSKFTRLQYLMNFLSLYVKKFSFFTSYGSMSRSYLWGKTQISIF